MHAKALTWLRKGNRVVRMTKVLAIAFLLYWLIQFVSTSFKVAEGFVAIGMYVVFLLWMKQQRAVNLRLAGMEQIDEMPPEKFEERLLSLFRDSGFRASGTKHTGDEGADIVLTRQDGTKILARCTQCRSSLGPDIVQQAVAAVAYYGADTAMVITNGYLTAPAKELARVNKVGVWERDELAKQLALLSHPRTSVWPRLVSILTKKFPKH